MTAQQLLEQCAASVSTKIGFVPKVALVLGSGLGDFAKHIKPIASLAYSEIEGFPVSTVAGHAGRFIFGTVDEVPVVAMQGRVHYYEGYSMSDVVLPIRLMGLLGASTLLLTNAAGGINYGFNPGDLMLITDQIASLVPSPLRGENIEDLGARFPDMSSIYNPKLIAIVRDAAMALEMPIKEGVYAQTTGPQYESPAEVRMLRTLGADAVGMSTACEAIAAHHMGLRVCGISCISNMASGVTGQPLSHAEVSLAAAAAEPHFTALISECVLRMGRA